MGHTCHGVLTRPSTSLSHFPCQLVTWPSRPIIAMLLPCHHVTWPSRPVIAMSFPTCLLHHAMSLASCLPSCPALSFKCQLCELMHTWTLHVWCVMIRPRGSFSSHLVVAKQPVHWFIGGMGLGIQLYLKTVLEELVFFPIYLNNFKSHK